MGLFIRIVIMVAALSGIIYVIRELNTKGIQKEAFYLQEETAAFSTSSVRKFEWRTQNKISSLEKNPAGQWIPFDRQKKIQEVLFMLSAFNLSDMEQKGATQISVVLDVAGEEWAGSWDGMTFLWVKGPLKGKGAILTDSSNRVFFRGRFLFDADPDIHLCSTRVNKIRLTLESQEYVIDQDLRGWSIHRLKKPMDAIFIEKWLIQACKLKVTTTIDPAYTLGVSERVNRMTLFYIDNKTQYDFFNLEQDLVMANDRALVLPGYRKLFDELKNEVLKK